MYITVYMYMYINSTIMYNIGLYAYVHHSTICNIGLYICYYEYNIMYCIWEKSI